MPSESMSPGARLTQLAAERPNELALICEQLDGRDEQLSYAQLEAWANRLSHRLAEAGVVQGSFVAVHLPNCVEHIVATLGAYKLGACPMPVNHRTPALERDAMIALAAPAAVISDAPELEGISREQMHSLDRYLDTPPADAIPRPYKAIASGGSTGTPKLIVTSSAFCSPPDGHPFAILLGIGAGDRLYSPGPLYHNLSFLFTQVALFSGASVVTNEKFDAERALAAIERHRPTVASLVPTMMLRMTRAPAFESADLSSLKRLWHTAAACPSWVKRAWIERIGAPRVCEVWAATEVTGITTIDGEEWLKRPGSVGRGYSTEIRVVDAQRRSLPPGEVGEIFTRFGQGPAQYQYLGAAPLECIDGEYSSVGDLGYLDEDGYLYLADRRTDMIVSGGANVYPAEVEAALTQFDGVRDAVVIGLKDDDLGRRVHALIEPAAIARSWVQQELEAHLRDRLAGYKLPRSYEIVDSLPRDEAGKIRRGKLRDERGG